MNVITRLPKFMPGQVIDLSYKYKGLPNRLLIKSVFVREQDEQWMYECIIESTGDITVLSQSFISNNMINKELEIYKCKEVISLYSTGWRFCGNFSRSHAHSIAGKHATNRYIKGIILRPALDPKGRLYKDNYGMWIKYDNIISNDGTINRGSELSDDVIVVK